MGLALCWMAGGRRRVICAPPPPPVPLESGGGRCWEGGCLAEMRRGGGEPLVRRAPLSGRVHVMGGRAAEERALVSCMSE